MPSPAELVAAIKAGRTWQQVADACAEYGVEHPRSYWHGIASGRIRPGWREVDALREAQGLEPQGPPPADLVASHDIRRVVEQDAPQYDTLALAYVGDADCAEVLVRRRKRDTNGDGHKPEVRVTAVTRHRERRPRLGLTITLPLARDINQWRNRHGLTWDEWHEMAHELMRREEDHLA